MGQIILLAVAAAVFPTLIACVAVMISRPEPRGLLLAFYFGGLIASLTAGVVVLAHFNDGNTVLGSTSSTPSPGTSIVAGLVSLLLAWAHLLLRDGYDRPLPATPFWPDPDWW